MRFLSCALIVFISELWRMDIEQISLFSCSFVCVRGFYFRRGVFLAKNRRLWTRIESVYFRVHSCAFAVSIFGVDFFYQRIEVNGHEWNLFILVLIRVHSRFLFSAWIFLTMNRR